MDFFNWPNPSSCTMALGSTQPCNLCKPRFHLMHSDFTYDALWIESRPLNHCMSSFLSLLLLLPLGAEACVKGFLSFQFLNLYTVGRTPWKGDQPDTRPLPIMTIQTQNKRKQTSMLWVIFEPNIPVYELAKTFHALDRATNHCVYCEENTTSKLMAVWQMW
jgi:hypothetical protein